MKSYGTVNYIRNYSYHYYLPLLRIICCKLAIFKMRLFFCVIVYRRQELPGFVHPTKCMIFTCYEPTWDHGTLLTTASFDGKMFYFATYLYCLSMKLEQNTILDRLLSPAIHRLLKNYHRC